MKHYTYLHRRADDGLVFYVGKGVGGRASSRHGRNRHWHNTFRKHGRVVEIAGEWPSEADAFDHERFLIASLRAIGAPLTNLTPGGERGGNGGATRGRVLSSEQIAKTAAAHRGMRRTAESRARMSAAARQRGSEWRSKIAAAAKTRVDHIAAMAAAQARPVRCVETGVVFPTRAAAASWAGLAAYVSISRAIKHGQRAGGYRWEVAC